MRKTDLLCVSPIPVLFIAKATFIQKKRSKQMRQFKSSPCKYLCRHQIMFITFR